jgi:O-glycosyl hydrolase
MRRTQVDFSTSLREWDGFGVNYVEASQTRDYQVEPQEYGGFSLLCEGDRQAILDMIFGPDGLRPGVVKMFLDPFHQSEPGEGYDWDPNVIDPEAYDHERTTRWMRYFVAEGLQRTRARGDELEVVVTLYGPPPWMTRQRFVRGRDLDPALKHECAKYMIAWAKYLREVEDVPVKYISLHNEGEDWERWPLDGSTAGGANHDYNLYWPPEQVADFIRFMPAMLDAQGMGDVGMAPGETTNWYRFSEWGYASAIANDEQAVSNIGLITSHGFKGAGPESRWYGDWRSLGNDILRARRPDLHSWVTSTSWSNMDVFFVNELRNLIYMTKVNAIIPWACIQQAGKWVGGDPNPGCAFKVSEAGYEIQPGYHYYKQVCRAGQPGMAVAHVASNDSLIGLIAFASNGTKHPDAFVVLNMSGERRPLQIEVSGSSASSFTAYYTSDDERHAVLGTMAVEDRAVAYDAPPRSVTTFYANPA